MSTRLLREYVRHVMSESSHSTLCAFDFDNTLCATDATKFEEFLKPLKNPKPLPTLSILRQRLRAGATCIVLTARPAIGLDPITQFFEAMGIKGVELVGVGSSAAKKKSQYIASVLDSTHYERVEFYDDLPQNVAAVQSLQDSYPDTEIVSTVV